MEPPQGASALAGLLMNFAGEPSPEELCELLEMYERRINDGSVTAMHVAVYRDWIRSCRIIAGYGVDVTREQYVNLIGRARTTEMTEELIKIGFNPRRALMAWNECHQTLIDAGAHTHVRDTRLESAVWNMPSANRIILQAIVNQCVDDVIV